MSAALSDQGYGILKPWQAVCMYVCIDIYIDRYEQYCNSKLKQMFFQNTESFVYKGGGHISELHTYSLHVQCMYNLKFSEITLVHWLFMYSTAPSCGQTQ